MILDIVRAQWDVHRAEKMLAECVVREHEKIADLHRFKAEQMQDSVNNSDLDIGWIHAVFNNHGRNQVSVPLHVPTSSFPQKMPDANGKLYGFICIVSVRELTFEQASLRNMMPVGGVC